MAGDRGAEPRDRPAAPRPGTRRQAPLARGDRNDSLGRRRGRCHDPGRAPGAHLHLLPPRAGDRSPGSAHPARGGRAGHRRDRPGVPGLRGDHEAPADPGEDQDQHGRHPVQRAAAGRAARTPRGGARRRVPDLQRGIRPRTRPGRRSHPARPGARQPAARRAGGRRPACADAAARGQARGAVRRPGPRAAPGPGPVAVELAGHRGGPRDPGRVRLGGESPGAVRDSGGDRRAADRGAARLAAYLSAVQCARRPDGLPGGPAEPRGRGRGGRRARRGAGHRGRARPAGLPVLALHPGRAAAQARPRRRGTRRVPGGPGACQDRAGAPVPRRTHREFLIPRLSPFPCPVRQRGKEKEKP